MSGIAGIVRFDGCPIDRVQLEALASRLGLPGGPAPEVRTYGPVGFALAPLDVDGLGAQTLATQEDRAPLVLCDARIDARKALAARLRDAGEFTVSADSNDDALIAAAWRAWGGCCTSQLLGDFAFVVWDDANARLFCARDHFGVKPFYYARTRDALLFSNSLECVRGYPGMSAELDELSIADFLLFGHGLRQDATAFRDIARLAPGHALAWDARHGLRIERWFELPLEEPLAGRRADELVDEFRALLCAAVADRLRGQRAIVSMSGGLDSTSVAATAREMLAARGAPFALTAFTLMSPRLLPADDEDRYARLAANHLEIPLSVVHTDLRAASSYVRRAHPTPEPVEASAFDTPSMFQAVGTLAPQPVLTGQGGDVGFFHERDYATGYLRQGRWLALAGDALRHLRTLRRMPPLYVRTRLRRALGKPDEHAPAFPPWLRADLAARHCLRERFESVHREPTRNGVARSGAHWRARQRMWTALFEQTDPAVTRLPLEFRHPYFDRRVLGFLLRLPELPWCVDKTLLRFSLRGALPEAVRTRPKSPVPGFPEYEAMRRGEAAGIGALLAADGMHRFVDVGRLRTLARQHDRLRPSESELLLRPLGLALWLGHPGRASAAPRTPAKESIR